MTTSLLTTFMKYLKNIFGRWNYKSELSSRDNIFLLLFTFFVGIFVLFLRKSDTFLNPQFWAEDGSVFFLQAHNLGFASIFQPYAGYFLLFPRLIALIARWFPVQNAPLIYNLSFIFSLGLILSYLFSRRIPLSNGTKFLIGLGIAIVPLKGEMLMTLTNAQWILALGLLLLLISRKPVTKYDKIFDVCLFILSGLTGPFIIIFIPLFLLKLYRQKTFFDLFLFVLAIIFSIIQYTNMIIIDRAAGKFMLLNFDFIKIIGIRFYQLILGFLPQNSIVISTKMQTFFFALFVIFYIYLLRKVSKKNLSSMIYVPLGGLLVLIASLYSFRANPGILASQNDRYFFITYIAIFWSLALIIRENKIFAVLMMLFIFLSFIPFLSSKKDLPLKDFSWHTASGCIDKTDPCVIPINPEGWEIDMLSKELLNPYGWSFKEMK